MHDIYNPPIFLGLRHERQIDSKLVVIMGKALDHIFFTLYCLNTMHLFMDSWIACERKELYCQKTETILELVAVRDKSIQRW